MYLVWPESTSVHLEAVRDGGEGADGAPVEGALLAEAAVLHPEPLQVQVDGAVLQLGLVLVR